MTPYKGPRTIEEWTKFVEGGYKDAKPEEIPTGPSVLKNIERFIEGIANEMMRLYKNDFTIFAVIVGVLGVTCFLTCWCAAKLGSDDDVSEGPNPNVVPKPTESSESKPPAAEGGDKKEKKD